VQLVGDGCKTRLVWAGIGRGPVLKLSGPSKARVRDLEIDGGGAADGILVNNIDQPGSRIFMAGPRTVSGKSSNLLVEGLDYAQVEIEDFVHAFQNTGTSVKVIGGPLAAAGNPQTSRVNIYSSASAGEMLTYDISKGAAVLVRDSWYESSPSPLYLKLTGRATLTMDNCLVSLKTSSSPAYDISNLVGKVTIIGNYTEGLVIVSGDGSNAQVLNLGAVSQIDSPYFLSSASPAASTLLLNSREVTKTVPGSRTKQTLNQGKVDAAFIRSMLAQTRTAVQKPLSALPPGVTDLRLDRVSVVNGTNNIRIVGTGNIGNTSDSPPRAGSRRN